jgi:iron complex outermembrane receptor protein
MSSPTFRSIALALAFVGVIPSQGWSQPQAPDVSKLSIEQLFDAELTSTASKFEQQVTRAPASVTVVTADDIRQHGYRTLADVLNSVRGFYTSYDRNYSYVGARGFARPGDYNTRVLLLVDGHRLNEPTYDMAAIGTDFPIEMSLIDRVEVIRGPASSLYGTSAFFAVINVITKTGAAGGGPRVDVSSGSLGTASVVASYGRVFGGGNEMLIAASGFRSRGNTSLYFPEFDVPGVSDGIARDLDDDDAARLFASASIGRLQIRGTFSDRQKRIPTASFGTLFGDHRSRTDDRRGFGDISYSGPILSGWTGVARAGVNYYDYAGQYPFDNGDGTSSVEYDGSDSLVASTELTLNRRFGSHLFTVGSELRRVAHDHQWAHYDDGTLFLDERHPSVVLGAYLQDEITLRRWLLVNAGLRVDRHPSFGVNATPRAGLVFLPRQQTSLKLLYGRAYRAPNSYELRYYDAMRTGLLPLEPETIATTEFVWEEYVGAHLRTGLSVFTYDARQLVEQRALTREQSDLGLGEIADLYFANAGRTKAHGVEGEVEGRWKSGVTARASYAYARAMDQAAGTPLSNSPSHLSKGELTLPMRAAASSLSASVRALSARRTLDGGSTPGFVLADLVSSTTLSRRFELGLGVYNLFDRRYADPGAEEHLQPAIAQDGRTVRVRLTAKF